jgi:glutamate/tyrosine decarboxylase-like PLP-dependent enzyme
MRKDGLIVQLDNLIREHPDFEALHEPTLNGYCFRCVPNGLVERQEEPEVEALLDVLNEEIVQAAQGNGFTAVATTRVQGRAAIQVSFCSSRTLVEEVDATFEAIARWGRLLNRKLTVRNETTSDTEAKLCSRGSHSSPTEVSAT